MPDNSLAVKSSAPLQINATIEEQPINSPFNTPLSILFAPADRPELAAKAAASDALAVCMDLEDGVAADAKPAARGNLSAMAETLAAGGKIVMVRVNAELEMISDDLNHLPAGCRAIILPKTRSPLHVEMVGEALDRIQAARGIDAAIIGLLECAGSLAAFSASDSVRSHPRLAALGCGTEDLAAEMDCAPDAPLIQSAFHQLAQIAKRLNVDLLGFPASIAEFHDLERFRDGVVLGAACGAVSALCIHPRQVSVVNDVLSPDEVQIHWAREVVQGFEQSESTGSGVLVVDGKMVDKPIYLRALRILQRS